MMCLYTLDFLPKLVAFFPIVLLLLYVFLKIIHQDLLVSFFSSPSVIPLFKSCYIFSLPHAVHKYEAAQNQPIVKECSNRGLLQKSVGLLNLRHSALANLIGIQKLSALLALQFGICIYCSAPSIFPSLRQNAVLSLTF